MDNASGRVQVWARVRPPIEQAWSYHLNFQTSLRSTTKQQETVGTSNKNQFKELDGKKIQENPTYIFDAKETWFPVDFPLTQSIDQGQMGEFFPRTMARATQWIALTRRCAFATTQKQWNECLDRLGVHGKSCEDFNKHDGKNQQNCIFL